MDCIRILSDFDANSINELLEAIDSSPRLVEDLVFFTSYFHCPISLEAIQKSTDRIALTFPTVRAAGYRAGINHLSTMGHIDENLEIVFDPTLPRITGIHGEVCQGTLCPNDRGMHDYVRKTYEILAHSHPDIIWVDDDVRIGGHMPAQGGCFCDACVADFSKEAKESFTRETLVAAFDDADAKRRTRIRGLFLQRNGRILTELLALIERTVHGIDPQIELGMMSGELFWEGSPFAEWTKALKATRWRPGGGFYDDQTPGNMIVKTHSIGRQVSALPPEVKVIQSEIENFPYTALRKSAQINVLETTAYLFAGCTGAAYNILNPEGNPLSNNEWMLSNLKAAVPFWNKLKPALAGSVPVGLWGAWEPLEIAAGQPRQGDAFFGDDMIANMVAPYGLSELGIPVCYHQDHGYVTALAGRMPLALGEARVKTALAQGVILDAEAAQVLHDMGLSHLVGVTPGRNFDFDTREIFTSHIINKESANWKRDCRQSFRGWSVLAHELLPLSDEVEALARITDYQGRDRGISLSVFTNELGGRVATMSYFPWTMNFGHGRRQQMVSLCDWLSHEQMPIRLESFGRITPWVSRHPDGRLVIGLLNLGADSYGPFDVLIRSTSDSFQNLSMDGSTRALGSRPAGNARLVTVPGFKPFSFEVILA